MLPAGYSKARGVQGTSAWRWAHFAGLHGLLEATRMVPFRQSMYVATPTFGFFEFCRIERDFVRRALGLVRLARCTLIEAYAESRLRGTRMRGCMALFSALQ